MLSCSLTSYCFLFSCSILCSFYFICMYLNESTLIYHFFLCLERGLSVFLSISNFSFFFLLLLISIFLSICHCLVFLRRIFFALYTVCVCVYLKWYFFRDHVFRHNRSRKKFSMISIRTHTSIISR